MTRRLDSGSVGGEYASVRNGRNGDEQAAYAVAAWLQRADLTGSLGSYFKPPLMPEGREVAAVEGWILGGVLLKIGGHFGVCSSPSVKRGTSHAYA